MKRRFWPALLFVLLLPLQSFAFMGTCDGHATASAEHCPQHAAAGGGTTAGHHCGDCCCMATATSPAVSWHPALPSRTEQALPRPPQPPHLSLDRLDRPPRLSAA